MTIMTIATIASTKASTPKASATLLSVEAESSSSRIDLISARSLSVEAEVDGGLLLLELRLHPVAIPLAVLATLA